ncbi:uncharacterized protein PAC_12479 [Phialocephala subalpina]|uniref:Uncharacterized protein n=1 Tax=Phialocephala subalpina TaxID=576137 RepID=A0A1L7XC35_9HELO|nr:uncharacterized protein PAC_12479 [Phialocephala subalpina]
MANQQLPPTYATPTAVRDFLATLLRDHHAVPESEVREMASKWRLGRGSELVSIGVETYRAILGAEVGAILFGHARKVSGNQKQGQNQTDSAGNRPKRKEVPKTDIFGLEPEGKSPSASPFRVVGLRKV